MSLENGIGKRYINKNIYILKMKEGTKVRKGLPVNWNLQITKISSVMSYDS